MNLRCMHCKGKLLCNRPFCPLMAKMSYQKRFNLKAKEAFHGDSPNVFIGHFGYPNINVGFLSVEHYNHHDEPFFWKSKGYSISKIMSLRSELVNSYFKLNIKQFDQRQGNKNAELAKELALAKNIVDVEVKLEKKPRFKLTFNQEAKPFGPSTKLKKIDIIDNIKVPKAVDKVANDTDLNASEAVSELYSKGMDEHYIVRLFSTSNLGIGKKRKFVPTRWSITAVDDTLGKRMINEVRSFEELDCFIAYHGSYQGNYFIALLFPAKWSYELFEIMPSTKEYATDFEAFEGRKNYADNTVGGYYAARLAVLEKLKGLKKQASVLLLRFITEEYWAPLGVWVVREAVRNAMNSRMVEFSSKELMLNFAMLYAKKRFSYDIAPLLKQSKLLDFYSNQKKLIQFF